MSRVWSFVDFSHDPFQLAPSIQHHVPVDWLWHIDRPCQQGKVSPEKLHSSLLLKMPPKEGREALEAVAALTPPCEIKLTQVFVSPVRRLLPEEVHCIGVQIAAPGLTALRSAWLVKVGVPQESWAVHVPYGLDSDLHISLAYIHSTYADAATELIKSIVGAGFIGRTMVVAEVVVEEGSGNKTRIPLKGGR